MPKTNKTISIPNGGNHSISWSTEKLVIRVTQACQWCYSDTNQVFSSLLPAGQYNPGDYGPYEATKTGTITYDDENPCVPSGGRTSTPHSITVTN